MSDICIAQCTSSSVSVNNGEGPDLDISLSFKVVCMVMYCDSGYIVYIADIALVDSLPSVTSSIAFCNSSLLQLLLLFLITWHD